ncbi:complement component C1q receptor-like [Dicentrarchus labrax]|uniref:complement component C1q receptor-like n=1 Tax=Dicentrarchus labrax TaxID=13489 RepID=UPI0021F62080|nr:complement component C1q receptor-like [Dicentrarchus labrax]
MNVSFRPSPLVFGYEWTTTYWSHFTPKLPGTFWISTDLLTSMAIMMLIFLLLFIHSFEGLSGAEHETMCTSKACFTLHMDNRRFVEAEQRCVHNGGHLMTVRDQDEENVLHSLLSQIHRKHQDKGLKFWIGLKLNSGDCVRPDKTLKGFKWVSGEENTHYSNWKKEPATTCTLERCVRIHYTLSGEKQLTWIAGSCKTPIFYACKFYFKGMCRPLALLGLGEIVYTAPFSEKPERSEMQSFPLGTIADILCIDKQAHYSLCVWRDNTFHWTVPGPFCKTGNQNCTISNDRCEYLCRQDADEVQCICKKGYSLDEDGVTCRIKYDMTETTAVSLVDPTTEEETHKEFTESLTRTTVEVQHQSPHTDAPRSDLVNVTHGEMTETTAASSFDPRKEEITKENLSESLTRTTVEVQHQSPHTDAPLPYLGNSTHGDQQGNKSLAKSFPQTVNSRVLICVLGSVIPLLILVAVTLAIAIFRCSRSKKEAKKNTTTDGYCWVSSGLDPRLEKLYKSISTDGP